MQLPTTHFLGLVADDDLRFNRMAPVRHDATEPTRIESAGSVHEDLLALGHQLRSPFGIDLVEWTEALGEVGTVGDDPNVIRRDLPCGERLGRAGKMTQASRGLELRRRC
ncbi:MAG: hypothetical protein M5U31_11905 [Acidimicrobiia bacterium]|nr:hypothetical protein [Acidimicrobiia bacterium]